MQTAKAYGKNFFERGKGHIEIGHTVRTDCLSQTFG